MLKNVATAGGHLAWWVAPVAATAVAGVAVAAVVVGGSRAVPGSTVVGQVTSIAATPKLTVEDAHGKKRTLHLHDNLYLGDTIVMPAHASATFQLRRPDYVSPDADLLLEKPAPGTTHTIKEERPRDVIIVTISD